MRTATEDFLFNRLGFLLLLAVVLGGCGGGASTSSNPVTAGSGNSGTVGYTGASAQTPDVLAFQTNLWEPLRDASRCGACHVEGVQSPMFVRQDDVNQAYFEAGPLVDRDNPANSRLVSKVQSGHNCWLPSAAACGTQITVYIENWLAVSGSSGRQIQLIAPPRSEPGATLSFPATAPSRFSDPVNGVWQILKDNCTGCHVDSSATPQAPFFASTDVDEAYQAAQSKMNLSDPASSRLVVRLRDEFHNCWTDCTSDADEVQAAITFLAGAPEVMADPVEPPVVYSKALTLVDGVSASGGNRYEADQIALYEFRTGTGNTIADLSGISPDLPLTISGDVNWVGGFGIQIVDGKAQGSTSNSKKLHDHIKATGQYSIEAWVIPANVVQEGPARIVSYSAGTNARNFTLGQTQYNYDFLHRSSTTDGNGQAALSTADADEDLQATLQHVVVTFDPVNGRRIYVNGVSTGDVDPVPSGHLNDWDDSYALVLGNEVSSDRQWQGTLRMVAIHNSALTLEQIQQNFAVGVGEKFFLLFNIGEYGDVCNPPLDPAAPNAPCPSDHPDWVDANDGVPPQSYIMFQVEQFDSYSYLFDKPTFINLDPNFVPGSIQIEGMRIGINSKEAEVGQSYANLSTIVDAASYDSESGQLLSDLGTVIALENGSDQDEFYLTFEKLGSNDNVRIPGTPLSAPPLPEPTPGTVSDIGIRTFDEVNAAMAAVTGVDPLLVKGEFDVLRQQLPSVENIQTFVSAHQMGIAQLSIAYCDALVEDPALRVNFFKVVPADPVFGFDQPVVTAFNTGAGDSAEKNQIVTALFNKTVGLPGTGNALNNAPILADIKAELIGPGGLNLFDRLGGSCASTGDPACQADRTRAIVKAMCASTLGSAIMLVQ